MIDPESAGYVVFGPTLRLLEDLHPRLPATFFHCFVKAVNRWIRVYDYRDALERVDFIKECCDLDGEQYEFPDVEGCIPAAMRRKPLSENWLKGIQQARRARSVRRMLSAVLELSRAAQRADRPILAEEVREQLMDCNPPLPGLLAWIPTEVRELTHGRPDATSRPRIGGAIPRSVSHSVILCTERHLIT